MTVVLSTYRPRYQVERIGGSYRIIDPQGTVIGGMYTSRQPAQTRCDKLQSEADQKAKRGPRACMCCGQTFVSDGIHNRLCNGCGSRSHAVMTAGSTSTGKIRRAARA